MKSPNSTTTNSDSSPSTTITITESVFIIIIAHYVEVAGEINQILGTIVDKCTLCTFSQSGLSRKERYRGWSGFVRDAGMSTAYSLIVQKYV